MPRRSSLDQAIRGTADAQLGLITAAQLGELGVRTSTTSRRSAGGLWTRVLPGVHLVGGGHPTRRQRELAALLYAGSPSMLTGTTALRRHGVRAVRLQEVSDDEPDRPEPVHLLVPHERRRLATGYVRLERTRRFPEDSVTVGGLVLAPVPRATADAARRMRRPSDVAALVSEVVHRQLADVDALRRELELGQMRGSGLLREALGPVGLGAASGPEVDLVRILEASGLPAVHYNVTIVDEHGVFVAIPDAWLDDVGLAIEVDSIEYHAGPDGFRSTVQRNRRYAEAGVPVLPLLPADLRSAERALRDIEAARRSAAARPRPRVFMTGDARPAAGRDGWRWGA
jgi:hypothetical protein